ncbi:MAG: bifunctional UDP-N-acetylglucosamine diphosphorylase/glucosamine-1-phosphate N-acetyltransferase GlmU, partial [Gammaproteobacteria bacterium]|nr:bifunctional UDP-N-acetylglucosamine diphosphorylase/glucosamine-1-phosphate N-acetyltransferase GlmU [Gammaproteobacteria bacterium]
TRMKSRTPKVLHTLGGKNLIHHVLDQANRLNPEKIHVVVSSSNYAQLQEEVGPESVNWVLQSEQLGTGHAVLQVLPHIKDGSVVLVLYGDVPRVGEDSLKECVASGESSFTVLTAKVPDPKGYGRIIRAEDRRILEIIEDRDLNDDQQNIGEINSGIVCGPVDIFKKLLPQVKRDNNQKEIYLTDMVGLANSAGMTVKGYLANCPSEVEGINSRKQLADMERVYQQEIADELMASGVTLLHQESLRVFGTFTTGIDCTIDANVRIEGKVEIGENVTIESGCVIKNSSIGDNAHIYAQTMIDGATIGDGCHIGPSARLRPGSVLHGKVRIGNFVEIKNATLENGVKAGHLAYLGDAYIGENTNIGAGAITCNFDGVKKNTTVIGKDVFVGTNCSLIAPLDIPDRAFIAAGTTITKKVPMQQGDLAFGPRDTKIVGDWAKKRGLNRTDNG